MHSGKTKHEVISEFRTAEILDAARGVFAEKGFVNATMDAIAERAGLAKGTLYLYFPSKRDVYLAALRQGLAELVEQTQARMAAAAGLRAKILAFIETRLEMSEQHRDFIRIYHTELGNLCRAGEPSDDLQALYERQLRQLEGALQAAVEGGEMRPLPVDAAALSMYEITRGWMRRRVLVDSNRSTHQDAEILTDILWKGIGL